MKGPITKAKLLELWAPPRYAYLEADACRHRFYPAAWRFRIARLLGKKIAIGAFRLRGIVYVFPLDRARRQ